MSRARSVLRQVNNRKPVLRDKTYSDFSGGWNTADNDIGLSSEFCRLSENVMLHGDGSYGTRWGTALRGDINAQDPTTATLAANPFACTAGSQVVVVTHANHGLLGGHTITFAGATDFSGIPAAAFNTEHDITYINANSYSIVVSTPAVTTYSAGGGSNVVYTHDNKTVNSTIINARYFQGRAVLVTEAGIILEQNVSTGVCRIIFDNLIAGKLVGAPTGWSTGLTFASFSTFNGELLIHNGIDKPLLVNFNNATPCTYLQDLGTGSNFNTPIGRYAVGFDRYHVIFGLPDAKDRVCISNVDTSGTYVGDPPPNDAVNVDIGKRVQSQQNELHGGARFRDNLVLAFDDVTVLSKLGIYDGTAHEPDFGDAIDEYGTGAHQTMLSLGDDLLMMDAAGVPSLARTTISNTIRPDRVSANIATEIQAAISAISHDTLRDRVFAVYNRLEGQYMLFIPNADTLTETTETPCFVLNYNRKKNILAWHHFRGWNFRCGFRSSDDRLYFCEGTKLYIYGSDADPISADFVGDETKADDEENITTGRNITFDWELPWVDLDNVGRYKHTRYLQLTSSGTAQFTFQFYVDKVVVDEFGADAPQLSLDLVGGDAPGFGGGEQPYGSGRKTNDPRPYAFTAKFKIGKMRLRGSTKLPLRVEAITIFYQLGSMRA